MASPLLRKLRAEVRELRRVNEILAAASAFFVARTSTRTILVRFVSEHTSRFGGRVNLPHADVACLKIAPSSYYDAVRRVIVPDERLKAKSTRVWRDNYGVYGTSKLGLALNRNGVAAARCTAERLMRELGLASAGRGPRSAHRGQRVQQCPG